jgi:hypothetical protein
MICVRLDGGIGNQLFQYAAGRALSDRHGVELLLDTSKLQKRNGKVTPRSFELHRFRIVCQLMNERDSLMMNWVSRFPTTSRFLSPWRVCVESGISFNPSFSTLPDQSYLVGYWQSHRYFNQIAKTLADELANTDPLSSASEEVLQQIDASVSVALHVRRGDYVSLASAAKMHGALDIQYYTSAVSQVCEKVPKAQFFVFSDDVPWCKVNLILPENTVFVSHNTSENGWQDLMLMGRCRHHVIANSSFSWWGSWCADQLWGNVHRLVIAPENWFGGLPNESHADRFPPHWLVLR